MLNVIRLGTRLARLLAAIVLAGIAAPACVAVDARTFMSEEQQDVAQLDDLAHARFWGDEVTPEIQAVIRTQYQQVHQTALKGERRSSLRKADYLAISGGGANGAFAAGVLVGWTKRGDRPEFEVVTGVSTGALAAPFAFLGPKYDPELTKIYTAYGDSDIMRSRGLLGVLGTGVYDNAPLRKLISDQMSERLIDEIAVEYHRGRRLLVQTTNIDAQRPVIWDISAISASRRADRKKLITDILLASAAIPAVFPPMRIHVQSAGGAYDELHVDGGVSAQVFFAPPNIRFADFERKEFGRPRTRSLYIIRNGRLNPTYELTAERTIPIAQRAIATLTTYQGLADLTRLQTLAQAGSARLFFVSIPRSFTSIPRSEFDKAYMWELYRVGNQLGFAGRWNIDTPTTPALAAGQ